ncbi:MAG: hypothetical protein IJW14_02955 [Oscillospiraceae bacterium]|nr:hypothetical protein [Oscillospiraceae bacterium]
MKKLLTILLSALMVLSLCACGEDAQTTEPSGNTNTPSTTPVGYTFTYNGYQFGVGMSVDAVLSKLGTPRDQYTSNSCAFGGEDTVYYYSSIQISTNDEEGYEKIYSIYLEDDLVTTEKGICIGNTADQVKAAYGEPDAASSDSCLIYAKDGMKLRFNMNGDKVSSITYDTL